MDVKIYSNQDVLEIIAAIPEGHYHTRFILKLKDQIIVLQEATVAGLLRAFALTALHPTRKGIILKNKLVKQEKKHGFAKYQLIEIPDSEEEAVRQVSMVLNMDKY